MKSTALIIIPFRFRSLSTFAIGREVSLLDLWLVTILIHIYRLKLVLNDVLLGTTFPILSRARAIAKVLQKGLVWYVELTMLEL